MTPLLFGVLIALVGFAVVERLARRQGAKPWPRRRRNTLLAALAGLVGMAYLGPGLGLRYGSSLLPKFLAAGLFLVLLVYLWQLVPRVRPLLGHRLPDRPSAVFLWIPWVAYLAIMPWATAERPPDGDEPYYLLVAHSLAYDFDAELTNNYSGGDSLRFLDRALDPQPQDPRGPNGEVYSRHNALLPAVLVPAYLVAGKHGALAVMCLFAAGLCWWMLRLARHYFRDRPGPVLIAYFVMAFTSPLLLYAHQVWVEIPAALLFAIAFDAAESFAAEGTERRRRWLAFGLPVLLLPLLKIRFILVVAPLLLVTAWRLGRRHRRLIIIALTTCVALGVAILWFNQIRYGNPLKYHHLNRLEFYWNDWTRYPRGLTGLFFDSAFGLFATAPIWALLAAPGRRKLALTARFGLVLAPYLLALVPRSEWYGAWSPPFRYGCFALPLLALLLVPALERRRGAGARVVLGALSAATVCLSTLWIARPGWTYNFAHGRSHLIDIVTLAQGVDVARFLPSAIRPNLALWLWPPIAILAVIWLWRRPARPWRGAFWLGAALPGLGLGWMLIAAQALPTTVIEAEDPFIKSHGGAVWPETWAVGRTRFRGGWRLRREDALEIPVVPGGSSYDVELELKRFGRHIAQPYVALHAGNAPAATAQILETQKWTTLRFEGLPWPSDAETLWISLLLPEGTDSRAAILLDQVRLSWSEASDLRVDQDLSAD